MSSPPPFFAPEPQAAPVDALFQWALSAHQAGALTQAEPLYREVLRLQPRHADALHLLGVLLHQKGEHAGALALIDRALALVADFPLALGNRGAVLRSLGRLDEALVAYDRSLAVLPDNADALISRAAILMQLRRREAALTDCERAIALAPELPEAWNNRGILRQDEHRFAEALADYEQALRLAPDYADAHWNLARCCLTVGDYARGWQEYEWRWQRPAFTSPQRHFAQPCWQGEALAGRTILLHAEQGFGDALQCLRFVPVVAALGGRVVLEVQAALKPFVSGWPGAAEVLAMGDALPSFDLHCPLLSLPLALGVTVDSIPPDVAPAIDAARTERWRVRLGPASALRVGLVWAGNPAQQDNDLRSVRLSDLLGALPAGLELVSLQKELRDEDERQWVACGRLRHFGDELTDFAETAALMTQVDVVVSVCTSVAHLAGVLGRPLELMLQRAADWRWLHGRADSPWYPTARLHRQSVQGDWAPVFAAVAQALVQRAQERR